MRLAVLGEPATIQKTKKMLVILAASAPQTPNMSALYRELETDCNQGLKMLGILERAELLSLLSSKSQTLKSSPRSTRSSSIAWSIPTPMLTMELWNCARIESVFEKGPEEGLAELAKAKPSGMRKLHWYDMKVKEKVRSLEAIARIPH